MIEANRKHGDRLYHLIETLKTQSPFDHPVERFDLLETHISYILLTGPYAYKFKKPVDLGFLDFTTLEKRRFYCEEELRLNRRLAPALYLTVIPITGTESSPHLGGSGPAIDYCVKMVQFSADAELDRVLERGQLSTRHIDDLAAQIAHFHQQSAVAGADSAFGTPAEVGRFALENFDQIPLDTAYPPEIQQHLAFLRTWTVQQLEKLEPVLSERKRKGWIRNCHGDMHLTNMALIDDRIVVFDCIEFNESLYWIDVINEIAFLLMDLDDRGRSDLAHRFLNRYLERTGDYAGLGLLDLYRVYRSLVRAKVAQIQYRQLRPEAEERQACQQRFMRHLALADRYTNKPAPVPLIITYGFSGSGKTWLTDKLIDLTGAIRLRSDIERKRLAGLGAEARTDSRIGADLYQPAMTDYTYERLRALAREVLASGFPVIVDAAFLKYRQRDAFSQLAATLGAPFYILHLQAREATLRERIRQRQIGGEDASEATLAVLDYQLRANEPLTDAERERTVQIETEGARPKLNELAEQLLFHAVPKPRSDSSAPASPS
jgi:aminoglycoside phosphotransferase family enzyme/predicted kinase